MLLLTKHAYAAAIEGGLVFLDLKSDDYTYVAPKDACQILPLISTPDPLIAHTQAATGIDEAGSIVHELQLAGLITAVQPGRPFEPTRYDEVVKELPRLVGPDRPHIDLIHVFRFIYAVLISRALLKLVSLDRVVAFVRRCKVRAARRIATSSPAELTEVYRLLRPLLLTRRDQCLLDSISLVTFLSGYGVAASLRFGIRLGPFRAHAWVQEGETVFDEMAALIHEYTVILEI